MDAYEWTLAREVQNAWRQGIEDARGDHQEFEQMKRGDE